MKIGLFFGSFNPVHNGHMVIAGYMAEFTDLDQVWFIVSPHNPLKVKSSLLQDYHRLTLVKLAIGDNRKLKASDIEFKLPRPSYTIHTLAYLQEKFPTDKFVLLLGSDNIETFHKWKNYEQILDGHELYVYPRDGEKTSPLFSHPQVKLVNAPRMELSSTFIRDSIKDKKDIRYMLPQSVWEYVEDMGFYK
ncbi:MAG: nicotinate-nucleotide adenylyltransferase [Bacteroidetes bacterium]|nr:nicotinate-nucleotide adenylyltransferase [Bacteroidota bacterium]MBK6839131.1 nicotinate-nucleotide adenylyltransferase [Bacteroidota bacterium]MBK9524457.1 nicotinate-nucleotide adenylyltransferase [Bacteroidota bacterium]MBP6401698.1 nicotinate-nucleotide adenylyltransferase [Bacteroidia bacterium]